MLTDLFVALTVILAMGFIPASFLVYLVHEKSNKGKWGKQNELKTKTHQASTVAHGLRAQLFFKESSRMALRGISPLLYWFCNYCWDVVNFLLPLLVCVVIFLAFQA